MMRTSHITRGLFVLFLCLLTACTSVKNMFFFIFSEKLFFYLML